MTQPSSQPLVDDGALVVLDGDGRLDHAEHAGTFAGSGADAAGEFREIVRLVKALERFLPATAEDEVVPLRDQVVDRAAAGHAGNDVAGVAERSAAIHAARALGAAFLVVAVNLELAPVLEAFERCDFGIGLASDFHESCWLAHVIMRFEI